MKGSIISILPDGTTTEFQIEGPPQLEMLKGAIGGGHLEVVPYLDTVGIKGIVHKCIAFCDEEGKIKGLSFNRVANELWHLAQLARKRVVISDRLVGPVAIVYGDKEFMEEL